MRRPWVVVVAWLLVSAVIGTAAYLVSLWLLLALPVALVGLGWLLGWAYDEPAPDGPVMRDEALW